MFRKIKHDLKFEKRKSNLIEILWNEIENFKRKKNR